MRPFEGESKYTASTLAGNPFTPFTKVIQKSVQNYTEILLDFLTKQTHYVSGSYLLFMRFLQDFNRVPMDMRKIGSKVPTPQPEARCTYNEDVESGRRVCSTALSYHSCGGRSDWWAASKRG